MSLESALISAQYGIRKAQNQLNVASANIANADREGYTRKNYIETGLVSINNTTVAYDSTVERVTDGFLTDAVLRESTELGYAAVTSEYLNRYDQSLGSTSGQNTLSEALNELVDSAHLLAQSPENESDKISIVNAADDLAYQLNNQSYAIQQLRLDADQEIDQTVDRINSLVAEIHKLNQAMVDEQARNLPTADVEDARALMLLELSGLMDIQQHTTEGGQIQIYTNAGQIILGSDPHLLTFSPSPAIDSTATFPGALSGVLLDNIDITSRIKGGELGALIDTRDTVLVEEQAVLDEFATELMDALNPLHNAGASVPGPTTLTSPPGFNGAAPLAGTTGVLRVAAIDDTGNVIEFRDINVGAFATLDVFFSQINTMANLTATRDSTNAYVVDAPASGVGIAIVELTPVDINGTGQNFGEFFQMNNFFDSASTNASNIRVRDTLLANPEHFSTAQLTTAAAATIAVGDTVVLEGDSTAIDSMVGILNNNNTFDSAGSLASQTVTFQDYVSIVSSSAAVRIEDAARSLTNAQHEYDTAKGAADNFSGVNIDEELTNVTSIQNAYASSAQVISTVQEMFETLLQSIR